MCFIGPVFDQWRELGLLDPRRPVHRLHPIDLWNERLESILGSANQPGFAPPLLEVCRLQEFLAQVIAGDGRGSSHQDDLKWIDRACRLVEATPHLPPDWPAIARQLGASVASFRKKFTRFTGHAPAKYRLIRRIDRACELMQQGRLTDRQIAERLGFCDEFYFSRRFKQITGKSPRALRRTLSLANSK